MTATRGEDTRGASGELAIAFEDVLRIPVKLRAGHAPDDLPHFRRSVDESIRRAGRVAEERGYDRSDVGNATYAVVALIDETALNSPHPTLQDWAKKTLQESYWGDYTAGETFYTLLDEVLARPASEHNADVLEVFQLSMLLGFLGRYRGAEPDRRSLVDAVEEKIRRSRAAPGPIAPEAALRDEEPPRPPSDPLLRPLAIGAVVSLVMVLGFFVVLNTLLGGSVSETAAVAESVRS